MAAKARCTRFDGATLENINFARAVHYPTFDGTSLHAASFTGANLSYASFVNADIPDITLDRANLTRASLFNVSLANASLVGTELTGADLTAATLTRANASFAVFTGAILTGADLKGGNFEIANFENAVVAGADFTSASLWGASFRKANLWAALPPDKQGISWTDFSGSRRTAPSPGEAQQLEQMLKWLRRGGNFTGTSTFVGVFNKAKNEKKDEGPEDKIWDAWLGAPPLSDADREYQRAIGRLITSVGCRDDRTAEAVLKWWNAPAQVEGGVALPTEQPVPEVDHRLDKMPERPPPVDESYSEVTWWYMVNPIPPWYNLADFSQALRTPTSCPAARAEFADLVVKIHNQAIVPRGSESFY